MPQKGIARDSLTYNSMIQGFCSEGNFTKGRSLFDELVAVGITPTASSYVPLIEQLCKMGKIEEGKSLWNEMLECGLRPHGFSIEDIIARFHRHENNTAENTSVAC
ncbi:hypothetical protein MLD38_012026 [Melastoma candidum]|nr:hypothetical protein MLD38_012026 [Melastoma candidum]